MLIRVHGHLFVCCSAPPHTPFESRVVQHPLNSQERINTAQAGMETCQLIHQLLYLSVAIKIFLGDFSLA